MIDPVQELKTRAEILHSRITSGDVEACRRLRALPELAKADAKTLSEAAPEMRRKHCLAVVAREHGFTTWEQAKRVLDGEGSDPDVGTLLYDAGSSARLNVWFASYVEARAHLDELRSAGERRYLLSYRTQFFVADRYFVEGLGLDPDDADWDALDFDWARPRDARARRRLYGKRLDAMRRPS